MKPRILDLFCGAGGAALGYYRAGFDVVGVDLSPQPHYPFQFVQCDALSFVRRHGREFDAVHASPPCQKYSQLAKRWPDRRYPDLIAPTRHELVAAGVPFVIENVVGAPLLDPVMLCGTMFGLATGRRELQRHRLFECSFAVTAPTQCRHVLPVVGVYGHTGGRELRKSSTPRSGIAERRKVMRIDWMNRDELSQAIPPAYSEYIGLRLMEHLQAISA